MLGQFSRIFAILTLALGLVLMSQSSAFCQGGNNGGGGGGNNGGGGGNNGGGGDPDNPDPGDSQLGGVEITAVGELKAKTRVGNFRQLNRQLLEAAQQSLTRDIQTPSKLRKVSLNRLEREVGKLVAAGKPIPSEMRYLAGMTKITHVFFYPETNDIVIAGPGEGYFVTAQNYAVGMQSGQATLMLEDLIVALRAFGPDGKSAGLISCSIDPTQEGLLRFRQIHKKIQDSGLFRPGLERQVVQEYIKSLGNQKITIGGISPKTNFARVMVEADYEMKLIGIGLRRPAVPITSFISKATPGSANSIQRWFFQPNYDCIKVNQEGTAMELVDTAVKLVGEDESVNAKGDRKGKGSMSRASRAYCASFTKNYNKLAEREPVWAELRNVIDMSVAAAFIQKMGYYDKAGWDMDVFGDERAFSVEKYEEPTQVAPVANAIWKGGYFMAPIAGGVSIQPRLAVNSDRMTIDQDGQVNRVRDQVKLSHLADGQWWWD